MQKDSLRRGRRATMSTAKFDHQHGQNHNETTNGVDDSDADAFQDQQPLDFTDYLRQEDTAATAANQPEQEQQQGRHSNGWDFPVAYFGGQESHAYYDTINQPQQLAGISEHSEGSTTARRRSRSRSSETPGEYAWDIKDILLPLPLAYDNFEAWPDGNCRRVYSLESERARRHQSGWAMRNTNNHNPQVLKKSCLGVLVCSHNCTTPSGLPVAYRPAICDKARKKQCMRKCTTPGCSGRLIQKNCKGHGGYPVTHFWRFANGAVYFQSKGRHDHVKPMAKTMGHGTLLGAAATNNSSAASSSASSSSLQSPRNSAAAAKMRQQQQLKLRLQMVREEREADRSGRLCIGHEYGTALKSNDVLPKIAPAFQVAHPLSMELLREGTPVDQLMSQAQTQLAIHDIEPIILQQHTMGELPAPTLYYDQQPHQQQESAATVQQMQLYSCGDQFIQQCDPAYINIQPEVQQHYAWRIPSSTSAAEVSEYPAEVVVNHPEAHHHHHHHHHHQHQHQLLEQQHQAYMDMLYAHNVVGGEQLPPPPPHPPQPQPPPPPPVVSADQSSSTDTSLTPLHVPEAVGAVGELIGGYQPQMLPSSDWSMGCQEGQEAVGEHHQQQQQQQEQEQQGRDTTSDGVEVQDASTAWFYSQSFPCWKPVES